MYYDQCRWWADHPPVDAMVAAYLGCGKKPSRPRQGLTDAEQIPLSAARRAALDQALADPVRV